MSSVVPETEIESFRTGRKTDGNYIIKSPIYSFLSSISVLELTIIGQWVIPIELFCVLNRMEGILLNIQSTTAWKRSNENALNGTQIHFYGKLKSEPRLINVCAETHLMAIEFRPALNFLSELQRSRRYNTHINLLINPFKRNHFHFSLKMYFTLMESFN